MDQAPLAAPTGSVPPTSGLPTYLTSFLGREADLARLESLLLPPAIRLLTITGFGGIGKTRLAVALTQRTARRWRRQWFVSLAHVHEPAAATSLINRELGLDTDHANLPDLTAAPDLLVLDNFEHLVDAADHVRNLLHTLPHLTILVTSRAPLNISGEQVYVLPPMPIVTNDGTVSALDFFVERARSHLHDFALTPVTRAVVQRICERLEGIPLALELAAARLAILSPTDMLDHLDSQLALLTGGPRDLPARQRTLRDTIAWSYDLLTADEQQVLQTLGVFSGGFTADSVAAVLDLPVSETFQHLGALIASSLVVLAPTSLTDAMRYRLLDPVREFAYERLTVAERAHQAHLAHARAHTTMAEAAVPLYDGPELPTALRATCAEVDNFRTAMAWSFEHGDVEDGVRLAGALWRHWPSRFMSDQDIWHDRIAEGLSWIERALELSDGLPFDAVREALIGQLYLEANLGRYDDLERRSESLMAWATDEDDAYGMYWGSFMLWRSRFDDTHSLEDVEATLEWLNGFARRARDPINQEAGNYGSIGHSLFMMGQYDEAEPIVQRALELSLQCGNPLYIAFARQSLGSLAAERGDLVSAPDSLRESIRLQEPLGNRNSLFSAITQVALVALRAGRVDISLRLLSSIPARVRHGLFFDDPDRRRFLSELREVAGEAQVDQSLQSREPLSDSGRDALLDELEAHLHTLAAAADVPSAATGEPGKLTIREVEVLRLLAAGGSNRAIADQLSISERTVENHVQHIFAKLDVPNRAGAAAWAVRHDLA